MSAKSYAVWIDGVYYRTATKARRALSGNNGDASEVTRILHDGGIYKGHVIAHGPPVEVVDLPGEAPPVVTFHAGKLGPLLHGGTETHGLGRTWA